MPIKNDEEFGYSFPDFLKCSSILFNDLLLTGNMDNEGEYGQERVEREL